MKAVIEAIVGLAIVFAIVAMFAWGQTHEMCATEKHKTANEVEACKNHWGTK